MKIILASSSPRRRSLLRQIGLDFDVYSPLVQEVGQSEIRTARHSECAARRRIAQANASLKAGEAFTHTSGDRMVIGADTIVVRDGEIMGKPIDESDARTMLLALSGRSHVVVTGLAVKRNDLPLIKGFEETLVTFRRLSGREIDRYIQSGEPMDKAGAYGIQGLGALLVKEIEGCYFNVMGLPLVRLLGLCHRAGIELL
ncbi:MAG: nucleoside triphosphate pyrophosphatase [Vulcanimicrobiota bacterium]